MLEFVPSTVESIDVIELEPEVLAANQWVAAKRATDPLADPRVRVHIGDARGVLQLTEKRYDAIVSQPSHPWTAGASHLYTREFFSLVRSHLKPDGVFVQWIGLNFVDEALLRSLAATLVDVFGHVEVYQLGAAPGLLFAASAEPLAYLESARRALQATPGRIRPPRIPPDRRLRRRPAAGCCGDADAGRRRSAEHGRSQPARRARLAPGRSHGRRPFRPRVVEGSRSPPRGDRRARPLRADSQARLRATLATRDRPGPRRGGSAPGDGARLDRARTRPARPSDPALRTCPQAGAREPATPSRGCWQAAPSTSRKADPSRGSRRGSSTSGWRP